MRLVLSENETQSTVRNARVLSVGLFVKCWHLNTMHFWFFCNLDAQMGENCGGAADGAAAAQISRGPSPCRTVGTSVPPVSLWKVVWFLSLMKWQSRLPGFQLAWCKSAHCSPLMVIYETLARGGLTGARELNFLNLRLNVCREVRL